VGIGIFGDAADRAWHLVAALAQPFDQREEIFPRQPRTLDHLGNLVRPLHRIVVGRQVIVESDRADAACRHPFAHFGFGGEIVGFMPEMKAGVRRKAWPKRFDGGENAAGILAAAQARLP